jgi:hypothetical protein
MEQLILANFKLWTNTMDISTKINEALREAYEEYLNVFFIKNRARHDWAHGAIDFVKNKFNVWELPT